MTQTAKDKTADEPKRRPRKKVTLVTVKSKRVPWPADLDDRYKARKAWHAAAMQIVSEHCYSFRLMATIWPFINVESGSLWPSNKTLAEISGCHEDTISNDIAAHQKMGLIDIGERPIPGKNFTAREMWLSLPVHADEAGSATKNNPGADTTSDSGPDRASETDIFSAADMVSDPPSDTASDTPSDTVSVTPSDTVSDQPINETNEGVTPEKGQLKKESKVPPSGGLPDYGFEESTSSSVPAPEDFDTPRLEWLIGDAPLDESKIKGLMETKGWNRARAENALVMHWTNDHWLGEYDNPLRDDETRYIKSRLLARINDGTLW